MNQVIWIFETWSKDGVSLQQSFYFTQESARAAFQDWCLRADGTKAHRAEYRSAPILL